jgi:hypothetical protein
MKRWRDVEVMIFEPAIDRRTEEKMLRGTLPPEDAPPEFARVAVLMRAASAVRTGVEPGSSIGEIDRVRQERMVASMASIISASGVAAAGTHPAGEAPKLWKARSRSAVRSSTSHTWKLRGGAFGRARLVLVMTLGLMLAGAGLAFAGVLPSPIQRAASVVLSKVGVHVPDHHPGSTPPAGHEPKTGSSTGGDNGNGKDNGNHKGQIKNGDKGKHKGRNKNGNHGDTGKHKGRDKGGKSGGGSTGSHGKTGSTDSHSRSGHGSGSSHGGDSGHGRD